MTGRNKFPSDFSRLSRRTGAASPLSFLRFKQRSLWLCVVAATALDSTHCLAERAAPRQHRMSSSKTIPLQEDALRVSAKPVWPHIDVAQREFEGSQMFVENDKGVWRAWVLSQSDDERGDVMDFFSGERQQVQLRYYKDGHQKDEFVDARGHVHRNVMALGFKDPRPGGGISPNGWNGPRIQINHSLIRHDSDSPCLENFYTTRRIPSLENDAETVWRKVLLYREASKAGCAHGTWESLINTALDLGDGTMLVTAGRFVFRLRMVDMSPVGSAPALRVVDATAIEALIQRYKNGLAASDLYDYLASQLNLAGSNTQQPKDLRHE
jgi:hypothetical protein